MQLFGIIFFVTKAASIELFSMMIFPQHKSLLFLIIQVLIDKKNFFSKNIMGFIKDFFITRWDSEMVFRQVLTGVVADCHEIFI